VGRTPDRFPGIRRDEGLVLADAGTATAETGEFRNNAGTLLARDSTGEFNLRSGGGGEINTGSNVGGGDVGVFDGKVGVDLQFRELDAINAQSLLTAVLNGQKIDLNVLHDSAFWNALKLLNKEINLTGLSNGDILAFDTGSDKFVRQAPAGGGGGFQQQHVNDETTNGSFTTLSFFLYWGSDEGATPNSMDIIAFVESATRPGSYRVQDTTNGNTIAEVTGVTDLVPAIISMGTVSNISTTQAIWELQALRGGTGAKFVRWETFLLGFA